MIKPEATEQPMLWRCLIDIPGGLKCGDVFTTTTPRVYAADPAGFQPIYKRDLRLSPFGPDAVAKLTQLLNSCSASPTE